MDRTQDLQIKLLRLKFKLQSDALPTELSPQINTKSYTFANLGRASVTRKWPKKLEIVGITYKNDIDDFNL